MVVMNCEFDGYSCLQARGGEVGGEADAGAQPGGLRSPGEVLDAVPAGGLQDDAAAFLLRVPVEGLLPHGLQVPVQC